MKISRLTFEGSIDEYRAVGGDLFSQADTATVPVNTPDVDGHSQVEIMRRMLRLKPIPPGQRALYRALHEARDAGLAADELAQAMGQTPAQLNGVLGALGRRVNSTPGVSPSLNGDLPGISLVLCYWRKDDRWWYALQSEFDALLVEEGIVEPS